MAVKRKSKAKHPWERVDPPWFVMCVFEDEESWEKLDEVKVFPTRKKALDYAITHKDDGDEGDDDQVRAFLFHGADRFEVKIKKTTELQPIKL